MTELSAVTWELNQEATYWPPGEDDGRGGTVFGWPVLIACRWQGKAELFRNPQGEQLMSSVVVYPDRALEVKGYLAFGNMFNEADYVNPHDVNALEIQQVGASPSLDATRQLNKVWL